MGNSPKNESQITRLRFEARQRNSEILSTTLIPTFLYFFRIFRNGGWGTRSPTIFFRQIFRMCRKTETVGYGVKKLIGLKLTFSRLPPDFFQIFSPMSYGTRAPQIFKKVDGVQTGGHFQGPPQNKSKFFPWNTCGNRRANVVT